VDELCGALFEKVVVLTLVPPAQSFADRLDRVIEAVLTSY
jgi:hypothetical protein